MPEIKKSTDKALEAINDLFGIAVARQASDLHLVAGKPPLLRINGIVVAVDEYEAMTPEVCKRLCFAICDERQLERFNSLKELDTAHQTPSGERFRVNLHWEKQNVALAARWIPAEIPTMESLILPEVMRRLVELPHGLVLVTGPTGSGKSTTLAAMIDKINHTEAVNIITLEDPIEFQFVADKAVIRQRQLGQDFLSFAEGLKHILRQDPDVVMVGEMRDPETIAAAMTIAETGHLVFATLHTYSAAQTIDRIIDAMPPHQQNQIRSQLALTLRAVVSQQLLPHKGGGRIAAREIMISNSAVANLIRENQIAQIKNVLQTSAKEGMCTLTQDLTRLIDEGLIDQAEANRYLVGNEKIKEEAASTKKKWI